MYCILCLEVHLLYCVAFRDKDISSIQVCGIAPDISVSALIKSTEISLCKSLHAGKSCLKLSVQTWSKDINGATSLRTSHLRVKRSRDLI